MLQETVAKMPEQEAMYYIKRCVDAGLWVPGKNDDETPKPAEKTDTPTSTIEDVD